MEKRCWAQTYLQITAELCKESVTFTSYQLGAKVMGIGDGLMLWQVFEVMGLRNEEKTTWDVF